LGGGRGQTPIKKEKARIQFGNEPFLALAKGGTAGLLSRKRL